MKVTLFIMAIMFAWDMCEGNTCEQRISEIMGEIKALNGRVDAVNTQGTNNKNEIANLKKGPTYKGCKWVTMSKGTGDTFTYKAVANTIIAGMYGRYLSGYNDRQLLALQCSMW